MKKSRDITKAVIAVAGYGTRFLPATKNQPKEMLPVVDKPIVHYLVEEAVASGIKDIILVTRAGQHVIEDYFDNNLELEYSLYKSGKYDALRTIRNIPRIANFIYVRQRKHLPYGTATPLLAVKNLIDDDEAFVYMFGDDLTISKKPVTRQLMDVYKRHKPTAVLAVQKVQKNEVERYGTVKYKNKAAYRYEIEAAYEKLSAGKAPSRMAQFGRFVFSYDVLREAARTPRGKNGELWLTDTLNRLAKKGKRVIAEPVKAEWLTTGDPLRYLQATVTFALARKEYARDFRKFLRKVV